jgi:hypothetical protein
MRTGSKFSGHGVFNVCTITTGKNNPFDCFFRTRAYLSLHILCVILLVDIRFWHLIFDSEASVSDLDGKTCRKPNVLLVY